MPRPPVPNAQSFSATSFADALDEALLATKNVLLVEHSRFVATRSYELNGSASKAMFAGIPQVQDVPQSFDVLDIDKDCINVNRCDLQPDSLKMDPPVAEESKPLSHELSNLDSVAPSSKMDSAASLVVVPVAQNHSLKQALREIEGDLHEDGNFEERVKMHVRDKFEQRKSAFVKAWIAVRHFNYHQIENRNLLHALEGAMAFVTIMNTIAVGASCDSEDWEYWPWIDGIFAACFLFEFFAKMAILGSWVYLFGHDWKWSWFELLLLILALLEVMFFFVLDSDVFDNTSLFRVFRLARLSKLLRMCKLHFVSDLVMMINGAIGGIRTLWWSIVSIALPLYVVAIVLRETLGRETGSGMGAEMFSSLAKSFFSIFRCVVAGDCSDDTGRPIFVLVSDKYGWTYGVIYGLTVVLMSFGLFNVIVAIYVENTVAAAKHDEMKKKEFRLKNHEIFKEKSLELAMLVYSLKMNLDERAGMGMDLEALYSMELTQSEFKRICEHPGFVELLTELDVNEENQKDLFDNLDVDRGGTLDMGEFLIGVSKMRGDARKADIIGVMLLVRHINRSLCDFEAKTIRILNLLLQRVAPEG